MSVAQITPHSDFSSIRLQSELLHKSEDTFLQSEVYHATGIARDNILTFSPREGGDKLLLRHLVKNNLKDPGLLPPFSSSIFHVYFADTDYPILYKRVDATLHFFLPGSSVNYDDQEYFRDSAIFSRTSSCYFGSLFSHHKPLNEMFRNFQFNGINCSSIKRIQMDGASLGGGMQHFLLVYILQNIRIFHKLNSIILSMAAPCCFHSKILQSLNQQFNDALLQINHPLVINMHYIIHLKDTTSRKGNPFMLQYTNKPNLHNVIYELEMYAYCNTGECVHTMQGKLSDKSSCDIVPKEQEYRQYHTTVPKIRKYPHYKKFETSDFKKLQPLIDRYFPPQHFCFSSFEHFFTTTYGSAYSRSTNAHLFILASENLADAILKKYESKFIFSDYESFKIKSLRQIIDAIEKLDCIHKLRDLARKNSLAPLEYRGWYQKYLELCSAKSELAKLIALKSDK